MQQIKRLQDEVKQLKRKRYGLVWDREKTKEEFEANTHGKLPVLKEVSKNAVKKGHITQPTHVLIEGDNYHALAVLNYTHRKQIDAIYIDPPYNTGSSDWKYNNNYVDKDDPFRHSKWLSMIYKRLVLAKNLLKPDGIICVTIDNHEIHNLRHVMEDVFPSREIIITVIEHNFRGRSMSNFALTHEYALWAVRKNEDLITKSSERSDDIRRNLRRTGNNSRRHESATLFYGIEVDKKSLKVVSVTEPLPLNVQPPKHKNPKTEMIWPIDSNGVERNWYYSPPTTMAEAKKGELYAKIIKGQTQIHYHIPGKMKRRKSVWRSKEYDASTYGSELLTEIIGENNFPYPKSIHAVKECIKSMTANKNAIILDFFAGSGTTGHAVLSMNEEDGGNRKFILCTNNEGDICTNVCYPRLKNVIEGYDFNGIKKTLLYEKKITLTTLKKCETILDEIGQIKVDNAEKYNTIESKMVSGVINIHGIKEIAGKKDGIRGNLKYFKTDFVGGDDTHADKKKLVDRSTAMLCLKEDCFGKIQKNELCAIFSGTNRFLGIAYDEHDGVLALRDEIKKIKGDYTVYVFSLDDSTHDEDFASLPNKIKIKPIPKSILDVYREIFR